MKTAMQDLKNDIIIEKKLGFITENSCKRIINYIDNLYLEKEKEQIADAFRNGSTSSMLGGGHWTQYYNQTYNQNK